MIEDMNKYRARRRKELARKAKHNDGGFFGEDCWIPALIVAVGLGLWFLMANLLPKG